MAIIPVVRYLRVEGPAPLEARGYAGQPGFITISREPGAGGRHLAEALVKELAARGEGGWTIFDAEAFRRVVREAHIEAPARLVDEERYEGPLSDMVRQWMGGPGDHAVMRVAARAMAQRARQGRVVFLGRGAVCVTRELGGVHVRLVASRQSRVGRLAARYNVGDRDARRLERELAFCRRQFLRAHFGRDIADPLLYDMVLNTDRVSEPVAAAAICDLLAARRAAVAAGPRA